uniref:WH2 domain-containing protein n=1 Tax=Parastrongyloides trichosuri TaxID=131310 RepID=A0A0N5A4U1_PARTI
MGGIFSNVIPEVSSSDSYSAKTPNGTPLTKSIEDPRSPSVEVKRTPLETIQQNRSLNVSTSTPIARKGVNTLRRKLLEKNHANSMEENK